LLCTDGRRRKLSNVYLANAQIKAEPLADKILPFIDLDKPGESKWLTLSSIGLNVRRDLAFYLRILGALPSLRITSDDATRIYSEL
jgi:hypothetical protein